MLPFSTEVFLSGETLFLREFPSGSQETLDFPFEELVDKTFFPGATEFPTFEAVTGEKAEVQKSGVLASGIQELPEFLGSDRQLLKRGLGGFGVLPGSGIHQLNA